jgi:hypothetical protein
LKLAIILAEFGKPAPDVSQYRECWPEADIRVYGDGDVPHIPQFDGPREGWRMNDYYKVRLMLDSGADIAMCFDGDMRIVDMEAARTLPLLAERFGLCLPINPRYTVLRDICDGADVPKEVLFDGVYGPGVNCSPIAVSLNRAGSVTLAEEYCKTLLDTPMRGPLAWQKSMWLTGIAPLILPPQWCVCSKHIGVGGEIILHEGHEAVKRHYGNRRTS